jgi:drug/metabolite transporter (DMT)-like permease
MSVPPPSNFLIRYAPHPVLAGALAMLCWSGSMIVVRDVAGAVPPVALSFFRCLIALALLWLMCRRSLRHQWPLMVRHWKLIGTMGALLFIGGNGMLFVGLQFTTAINAGLINSAEPVAVVAVAWLLYRDRLTPRQWFGVVVSAVGVVYLIAQGRLAVLVGFRLNIGDMFILVSIVSWAFYSMTMRHVPLELDRLNLLFGILFAGSVMLFPIWILEHLYYAPTHFGLPLAWATGFNAVFASILAMFWWNHSLQKLGPGRASLLVHLIPVYTVILAVWFLGEQFKAFHAIGIALIGIGIWLTTMQRGKQGAKH